MRAGIYLLRSRTRIIAKDTPDNKIIQNRNVNNSDNQNVKDVFHDFTKFEIITEGSVSDILADVRRNMTTLERGYRRLLYQEIARAAAIGLYLENNPIEWKEFCEGRHWSGAVERPPKQADHKRAVYHVLRFVRGGCGNAKKDASLYVGAIGPLLKQGTQPSDLPSAIEEAGGIRRLYDRQKSERQTRKNIDSKEYHITRSGNVSRGEWDTRVRGADVIFNSLAELPKGSRVAIDVVIESVDLPLEFTVLNVTQKMTTVKAV